MQARSTDKKSFGKRNGLPPPPPAKPAREVPEVDPRYSGRKRVLQSGKLCFGKNLSLTVDCIIHDVSDAGMRVQVQPGPVIPAEVVIVHLRTHRAYTASVAWQRRGSIGFKFLSRHDLNQPETPEMEALRQYCVEHDLRASKSSLTE
jgi:hypothetical protein